MEKLKIMAQEIYDSYHDRNLDEIGIIELRKIKKDYEALHHLNTELKNKCRFDTSMDTADYDELSEESSKLWTMVQRELPAINEMLNKKSNAAIQRVNERREITNNLTRNTAKLESIKALLNDFETKNKNASKTRRYTST